MVPNQKLMPQEILTLEVGSLSTFSDKGDGNLAQNHRIPRRIIAKSRVGTRHANEPKHDTSAVSSLKAYDKQLLQVDTELAEGLGLTNLSALRSENSYDNVNTEPAEGRGRTNLSALRKENGHDKTTTKPVQIPIPLFFFNHRYE